MISTGAHVNARVHTSAHRETDRTDNPAIILRPGDVRAKRLHG